MPCICCQRYAVCRCPLHCTPSRAAEPHLAICLPWLQGETVRILRQPEPEHHNMDIVFFHGLQLGGWQDAFYYTWVNTAGTCWPRDWLPQDFPGARIVAITYDSSAARTGGAMDVDTIAAAVLADLQLAGIGVRMSSSNVDVPVTLVGHSLGGIVLKAVSPAKLPGAALVPMQAAHGRAACWLRKPVATLVFARGVSMPSMRARHVHLHQVSTSFLWPCCRFLATQTF